MTTRNITKQFESLRAKAKVHHDALDAASSFSKPPNGPGSLLPNGNIDSSTHPGDIGADIASLGYTAPPKWVDIADNARADMEKIDNFRTQLENAYSQRLKVSFGDDAGEKTKEELIENLTGQTTALIKSIETKIKKIAFADEDSTSNANQNQNDPRGKQKKPRELSQNEKNIRLNVMRNLGAALHTKTKAFKNQQRDYLARLQKQQHIGNDLFAEITTDTGRKNLDPSLSNGDLGLMLDMALEQGLSDEQQRELDEIQERADDREKEIIGLVQNINELAGLFSELNVLVIEQGTLLDRIDYNVEQAVTNIHEGRVQLEKAEEKSSANWILKLMIGLLGLIVLEVILLAIKWKIMGR